MRKLFYLLCVSVIFVFLTGCASVANYNFKNIDRNMTRANYSAVVGELDKAKIYSDKDIVLQNLDYGLLNHYQSNISQSNKNLETAEEYIRKYYAKSISQNIGSYIVNDQVKDYEGDFFEDIYVNIFMALNYLAANDRTNAFVEIRKFDEKMKVMSLNYSAQISALEKELKGSLKTKQLNFHDSALARYLSLLMYRSEGDKGNAKVDLNYIQKAFANQNSIYNFKIPSSLNISDEIEIPKDMARLNVLAFSGLAPVKTEEVLRINFLGNYYKLALPKLIHRNSDITAIRLKAKNLATGKTEYKDFQLLESLENISKNIFASQLSVIEGRALIRSISKTAAQMALREAARRTRGNSSGLSTLFSVGQLFTAVATEVTEKADTRCCRYFPAKASIAGINLEKGDYEITVEYLSGVRVISSETVTKKLDSGKLNFVETFCLK